MAYHKHTINVKVNGVIEALDLTQNFGHAMQKAVEELNDVNEVKRQGSISSPLPLTPQNERVLQLFRNVGIVDNVYEPLPCEAFVGHVKLPFDRLRVTTTTDREDSIEVELFFADDFWFELAENTKLIDLDFGSFTFSAANVLDNMQNGNPYDPTGSALIWCPLIDTGRSGAAFTFEKSDVDVGAGSFSVPGHGLELAVWHDMVLTTDGIAPAPLKSGLRYPFLAVTEDLLLSPFILSTAGEGQHYLFANQWGVKDTRPLFSVPGTLISAFFQIGWRLEGEILSHPDVLRWWQYILGNEFYNSGANELSYKFQADRTTVFSTSGSDAIEWNSASAENYGSLLPNLTFPTEPDTYRNDTGKKLKAKVSASILVTNTSATTQTFTVLVSVNDASFSPLLGDSQGVLISAGGQQTIEVGFDYEILSNYYVEVGVTSSLGGSYDIGIGSYLRVEPQDYPKYITTNSTHELAKLIDGDLTVMDLLKGFAHTADLKLKTNFDEKIVTLYPSEATTWEGESLEGFWKPSSVAKDMTALVEKESRVMAYPDEEQPRYVWLRFQESKDDYISENFPEKDESPVHGREIDMGERFKGEPLDIENPLYEPTLERQIGGVVVPVMWDNDNNRSSYNIGPRILYGVGYVGQVLPTRFSSDYVGTTAVTSYIVERSFWYFEGQKLELLPYASQLPGVNVYTTIGGVANPVGKHIVYGVQTADLYETFWSKDKFIRLILPSVSFLVRLTLEGYIAEDFRTRWFVHYRNDPWVYRLVELVEHFTGDDSSTEAVLVPETTFTT